MTDLVAEVGSSQSNVSSHLAYLRDRGLVVDRPAERRQVFYSIAQQRIREVLTAAERLLVDSGEAVDLRVEEPSRPRRSGQR